MRYSVPIQQMIESETARIAGKGFDSSSLIIAEISKIHRAVRGLEDISLNKNPAETDAIHARRTHQAGTKLAKAVEATKTRSIAILNEQSAKIVERLREVSGIRPADGLDQVHQFGEIRAVVRGMPLEDRHGLVADAMKTQDAETLSALFTASPYLSGLDAKVLADTRDAYERRVAPHEVNELESLIDSHQVLESAIAAADGVARESQDPAFMAKIIEAERQAEQAAANFDAATS